jgi:hypothetical protein
MYDAAYQALKEIGTATHVEELWRQIQNKGYFKFGAKDPGRALGVCLDRHSYGARISRGAEEKRFYRSAPNTYALWEWADAKTKANLLQEEEVAEEEITEELDTGLFWEQDWQRWLFNNMRENHLRALKLGALTFHDPNYQEQHLGHYSTDIGEMDFLLRTASGDFVVVELKRKGDDETVGQICRYVGWAKKYLANPGQKVFGVILSARISERLRCAIQAVDDKIHYQELVLKAEFGESSRT